MHKYLSLTTVAAVLIGAGCLKSSSTAATEAGAASLPITPENTKIQWVGTKPNGKHNGGFGKFSGSIDDVKPGLDGSKITVQIDTESLTSDTPKLTSHLKSPDFFDVKEFPQAKFVSTKIEADKAGENTHKITGDLTLHGVTKTISFPAKVAQADGSLTIESTFKIDRTDFKMTFGPGKVDNDVTIKVNVQAKAK